MKFRERFMLGETDFEEIYKLTSKWNFSDETCTLREYLGLTAEEEDVWISDSDEALEDLLEKEKATKAIFLDLDGTLFTDDKEFTDGNRAALDAALKAGHKVIISTGRPLMSARQQAKKLGFTGEGCYVISYNGGLVYDMYHQKTLYRKSIPVPLVRQVLDDARAHHLHCQTYDDQAELVLSETDNEDLHKYAEINHLNYKVIDNVTDMLPEEPVKLIVIHFGGQDALREYEKATAKWSEGKIDRIFSSPYLLEHIAPGVSKGAAVEMLCETIGVPLCNTVAAGDQENDISMIKAAAVGCAMKNAVPSVLAAADYVTTHDNNHDGVAEIIYKFILNQ